MECKDGIDMYKMFESIHRPQLESSGVLEKFWFSLYKKITNAIFDAGDAFSIFRVEYDDEKTEEDPVYTLLVTKEDGICCNDPSQIYLIDHAWTYEINKAADNLTNVAGLLDRMCNLMGLKMENSLQKNVENVCREMWRYNQTYSQGFGSAENRIPLWYIMDELGSAIEHSDSPNCRVVPFLYVNEQITYSLLFPLKNLKPMEKVTRDYLEGPFAKEESLRKALMIPWRPSSFLDVDFSQEPNENYFKSQNTKETLPSNQASSGCDKSKILKVFSEYRYVNEFLRHPGFEIVSSSSEADILWLMSHFKNYERFREESPGKFINQFPCESVLTMKNLLSVVCRRKRKGNPDRFSDDPDWWPTTYDLKGDLVKFVSFFQNREKIGLDNIWICKPWNLARGLGITVTDNLNCIVRLPSSGPYLAQKYLTEPVLFDREDVGLVKFDVRYVVLLKSVDPLLVYAYRNFFPRFANKQFELNEFSDREKHFTVMNYDPETPLYEMLCGEFAEKFNRQNPFTDWDSIEKKIFHSLRELFEAASAEPPPQGIASNPQSRALYAVDLMISREISKEDGSAILQPKILELNWMPDCRRACEYYPSFFDDVFLLLFKDDCDESKFQLLQ